SVFDFANTHGGVVGLYPGKTFTLSADLTTAANDEGAHAMIRAQLLGIDNRDASGQLVSGSVVVIPEPGTFALMLFAVGEIAARRKGLARISAN
ncbi:MAG: PEP-CTERM sorting domain-containing protein, partial [Bryobacteraceae bacterium]